MAVRARTRRGGRLPCDLETRPRGSPRTARAAGPGPRCRPPERAVRLREELGEGTSVPLATRAGELFADAGERAFAALDLPTARDLLGPAASRVPRSSSRRPAIPPNLGVA